MESSRMSFTIKTIFTEKIELVIQFWVYFFYVILWRFEILLKYLRKSIQLYEKFKNELYD